MSEAQEEELPPLLSGKLSLSCHASCHSFLPYYQLSEEEQLRREERERRRVERLMASMRARGRVIAPYNTTQFLIEEHETEVEADLVKMLDNDGDYSAISWSDEEDFMSKEFNKHYEQEHFDNLTKMNKEKLLFEYLSIAKKNEKLEEKVSHFEEEGEKVKALMRDMSILQAQNMKLKRSNSSMKERIRKLSVTAEINSDSPTDQM